MKVSLRQETNFSHSITGTLWHQILFEGHFLFRGILHTTRVTFETTSSLTVVEPFIDLRTPNVLVFTIALYNILQFICCQCSHANFVKVVQQVQQLFVGIYSCSCGSLLLFLYLTLVSMVTGGYYFPYIDRKLQTLCFRKF